ncbi:hypothetical protein VE25_11480 [Devosia geojensis]|uniref:Polysaccharide chain length determinant N-terminal domain-containing protein n=1 Tax=Devosia geojensis TaxID=443610 RepID=A0A0F5FUC1_9HYPH|nr:Wzz/FepE/Etk N-terminal domain-containing protein [Devosia geojensis]KKB11777.1 hypothetical protein VE25_11480 [Devosia geojensis]
MLVTDLYFYGVLLLRRLPVILFITLLAGAGGLWLALAQQPQYRSTATILVESPEIPADLARSTVLENAIVQVQIIEQQLLTDRSLAALADRFDVYPPEPELSSSDIAEDMRERVSVERGDLGDGDRSATAFKISFDAATPQLAADVANHLASTILQRGNERRASRASETLEFFKQDVARLTAQLASLDQTIQLFKSEHLEDLPDSLEFRRLRQGNLEERLLLLEREAVTLRSRRANLALVLETKEQFPGGDIETPQGKLLAELQQALLAQSTVFGPDSPSVRALGQRIAALQPSADAATAAAGAALPRPVSDLELQFADVEDQLAAIAVEKNAIERSLAELAASIEATPQNETALDVLERDRTNVQALHALALARLAEATTGAEIEARFKGERLLLVEAALPPENPLPTKRRLIVGGALAGGLVAALALILGLEVLNRRVRRPVELERRLDIQPMVTIPYVRGASDRRRRRLVVAASVMVTAALAITPMLVGLNPPLNELGSVLTNSISAARSGNP